MSRLAELSRELGPDGLRVQEKDLLGCARDCWPQALGWSGAELKAHAPQAVLRPRDEEGVRAALEWSQGSGVPLVPRGAGSGVLGAAIPPGAFTAALDLSGLTSCFELTEGPEPVLRASAGMLGGVLESRLNARGHSLLHFPQSLEDSSPGGWVAADGWGQLSTRHGPFARQASLVRTVLPGGKVLEEPTGVHFGAEGTLGVITEVVFKVRRLPRARRFHARGLRSLEQALDFAREAAAGQTTPSVLRVYSPFDAFFNGLGSRGGSGSGGGLRKAAEPVLLRWAPWLNALAPLVGRQWVAVLIYEEERGYPGGAPPEGGRDLGEEPARRWWERRYHLSKARLEGLFARGCFADTVDLWAPWPGLAALEREVRRALSPHALAFSHFSHCDAEGACLYVTFAGAGGPLRHRLAWTAALDAAARLGAKVNHHHGVGLAKLPWLSAAKDAAWLARWREEKLARDPKGLLNPGKLCP